jgi:hypothetical protein
MKTHYKLSVLFSVLLLLSACGGERRQAPLEEVVSEVNAKCPVMVDSETRIDGVELRGDSMLRYSYTLVNLEAEGLDTAQFRQLMWPGLVANIRVTGSMQQLRDAGVVFEYLYKDKNGKQACLFTIRPADYR